MVRIDMSWDEIKRRAKNGAPLTVLAELNGVNNETMKQAIAELEKQTGEKCVFSKPEKPKKPKRVPLDKAKVVDLYKAGMRVKDIAEKMGTCSAYISVILTEWRKKHPEEAKQKKVQKVQKTRKVARKVTKVEKTEQKPSMTADEWEAKVHEEAAKIKAAKIMIDPGVADVIENQIDSLKDVIQKHLDQIEILKKQLKSWEDLLNASIVDYPEDHGHDS